MKKVQELSNDFINLLKLKLALLEELPFGEIDINEYLGIIVTEDNEHVVNPGTSSERKTNYKKYEIEKYHHVITFYHCLIIVVIIPMTTMLMFIGTHNHLQYIYFYYNQIYIMIQNMIVHILYSILLYLHIHIINVHVLY
ncbi:hypothetical protein EDI_054940 [Entamoeba dispar SAW760]|uniref:Uncharacterized protein n=1 Tax=Entamoeba dispar (strain ATCC PRA-260 / SAW760) TaxID=370354 RepID=B0E8U3_ENTDS|nr:uncharacterized protein EDI_054940 [Entamoeba dispar SAW760]EDR29054.1 hypothetical protein EDI_054940 [Entamoeba dispar SAW760]|eukprot:EDR29054.1 hypothetical protein EDI_054940 [Entamoeba dispar SAW760]